MTRVSIFGLLPVLIAFAVNVGASPSPMPSDCIQELTDNMSLSPSSAQSCSAVCQNLNAADIREVRACRALEVLSQMDIFETCRWTQIKSRVWEISDSEQAFLKACSRQVSRKPGSLNKQLNKQLNKGPQMPKAVTTSF